MQKKTKFFRYAPLVTFAPGIFRIEILCGQTKKQLAGMLTDVGFFSNFFIKLII